MKRLAAILCALVLLCLASLAPAAHDRLEKDYQAEWCTACGGTVEYVLPDKTRVDCMCGDYAIEFDFAQKWAEAIGQALYYSLQTGKKPGVVLIMENPGDDRYLRRLEAVAYYYAIKVWTTGPGAPK